MNLGDVAGWIEQRLTPYSGDESFLAPATDRTKQLWAQSLELIIQERKRGILDADVSTPSTIVSHSPGYLDKAAEKIVGFQTDAPLKRAIKPAGGVRIVENALKAYGYTIDPKVVETYTQFRKTHNQGVFDAYTEEMRIARREGIMTGLPDSYGRGRIIGDYRRVALYGVDQLIKWKLADGKVLAARVMDVDLIRLREELSEQINALKELKAMAATYGCDISKPAETAQQAIQWTWLAYLGATKQQDGAAMSFGKVDGFWDIYIEEDLKKGLITESEAQELIDDVVMKMRLVRHLRPPEYNDLFAGDPTWITCAISGMDSKGGHMVTKTSFRILHTLVNLGPAPEPNITVLFSQSLPEPWKLYCASVTVQTSSLQYENDDLMRPIYGSDYGIACCVSALKLGKEMQFFGARANMAKLLLYALNNGKDDNSGVQVAPAFGPVEVDADGRLNYQSVEARFDQYMDWLVELYVNTMNIIHFMHDKYSYESLQMALHDTEVHRFMAFGLAGLSVVVDSLSAIKYGGVVAVRDERGITTDFNRLGEWPAYGNDDDRVDSIAVSLVETFMAKLRKRPTYRNAEHTLSILTITSNVVYGHKTGTTPDGRQKGAPFAPGANPLHGRDVSGPLASLNSVAKIPYQHCRDGVSNTFSLIPAMLGKRDLATQHRNLVAVMEGYFEKGGFHLNVNCLSKETLLDAVDHPEKYPQLTIRVSGYAVAFTVLSREHQLEVIARTFHQGL